MTVWGEMGGVHRMLICLGGALHLSALTPSESSVSNHSPPFPPPFGRWGVCRVGFPPSFLFPPDTDAVSSSSCLRSAPWISAFSSRPSGELLWPMAPLGQSFQALCCAGKGRGGARGCGDGGKRERATGVWGVLGKGLHCCCCCRGGNCHLSVSISQPLFSAAHFANELLLIGAL